jgi:SagB-type dehydrogenase family enzyme
LPRPEGPVGAHLLNYGADEPPAARLELDRVAALLLMTAGIRQPNDDQPRRPVRRWAPTGGNLGSVELYLAACDITGVEPGLYFYQPHEHILARLGPPRAAGAMADFIHAVSPQVQADTPGALIISAGALHRVARKYGAFGYRIINLDAGVALAQSQMVARGLGLKARAVTAWSDDVLEEGLDLQTPAELVTAVLALWGKA